MPYLGELAALLTAVLWSGSALIFAHVSARISPLQVNILRLVFGSIYLLGVILLFHLDLDLTCAQLAYFAASGVVGLALGDTFLFKAYKQLGARLSMLIMSLAPAFGALLAWAIIDDTLTPVGLLGMSVTVGGVALVVMQKTPSSTSAQAWDTAGLLFALLAAAGQGVGLVFAKMAFNVHPVNGFVATAIRITASLVILIPASIVTGRFESPMGVAARERRAFVLIAVGSILGPFLGIAGSLIAVANTSVGVAAAIMGTVPVIMLPMVSIIHTEHLTRNAIAGALLATAGVTILFLR
jgi:drug/metabolite transporter (DMT)-like permease